MLSPCNPWREYLQVSQGREIIPAKRYCGAATAHAAGFGVLAGRTDEKQFRRVAGFGHAPAAREIAVKLASLAEGERQIHSFAVRSLAENS